MVNFCVDKPVKEAVFGQGVVIVEVNHRVYDTKLFLSFGDTSSFRDEHIFSVKNLRTKIHL